jgi:transposase
VSLATAHRRFTAWTEAGLWPRLHRAILDLLDARGEMDRSSAMDAASVRAKEGSLTGPNPVDRAKLGSKLHVISTLAGIPLVVGVSAANKYDSQAGPLTPPASKAACGRGLRRRPAPPLASRPRHHPCIAVRGTNTREHLGRHRWKIERTIAWLTGFRRLTIRYERHASLFGAFPLVAAALTCFKKLAT